MADAQGLASLTVSSSASFQERAREMSLADTKDHDSYHPPTSMPEFDENNPSSPLHSLFPSAKSNPKPQVDGAPMPSNAGTNGDKLVVVMVGLPGRSKTYIAQKLARYMGFFHGVPIEVFNVGNRRRQMAGVEQSADFWNPNNQEGVKQRLEARQEELDRIKIFMNPNDSVGKIAIYDSSNLTRESRDSVIKELKGIVESSSHLIFLESVCDDDLAMELAIEGVKRHMPDYQKLGDEHIEKDYRHRIEMARKTYEPISDVFEGDRSYIRITDVGRQVTANRIKGYLQTRVLQFSMCLRVVGRPIYLSRHGQSEYNVLGKIGGDSGLSPAGQKYMHILAKYTEETILTAKDKNVNSAHCRLWTSSLKRTIETASKIKHELLEDGWVTMRPRVWRNLDELFAGRFDGMTYKEIEAAAPEEFMERQRNKLSYRYPRGESYLDVISRLEMIVNELERQTDPVLIVSHQGVLRIIYAYFMNISREKSPKVDIPLNTIIKLVPRAYGCDEERICLIPGKIAASHQPSH